MGRNEREMCIAESLRDQGAIDDLHYRLWVQRRKTGKSMYVLRHMFRRNPKTLWRWYQIVQYAVEQADHDDGDDAPLDGVTVHRNGAWPTETPLVRDIALKNLGI